MTDPKDMDFDSRKEYDQVQYDIQEAKNDFRGRLKDYPVVSIDIWINLNKVFKDDFVHPLQKLLDWCKENCKSDWTKAAKFDNEDLERDKLICVTMKFYFQDRDEAEEFKLRWSKDSEEE